VFGPRSDAGSTGSVASAGEVGARSQRYNYLVGRLRSRQITMEEATELFTLMQGMLARANELARVAAIRSQAAPAAAAAGLPSSPRIAPATSGADDLFLVGILAMGAGAGLLAAMTKRIGDSTPPASSGSGRSTPGAASE